MKFCTTIRAALWLTIASTLPVFVASAHAGGSSGYYTHLIGTFTGVTRDADDETDSTLGLEYEYRFNKAWGLGAVYETTPDGHTGDGVDLIVALAHFHVNNAWRFSAGFGQEEIQGKSKSLSRVGVAYDFHFSNGFGLAPSFNIDEVDGESIEVLGLVLSKGF